jgi:class 3 adenylate cyclase
MLAERPSARPSAGRHRGLWQDAPVDIPDVHYARSGSVAIAYQSVGDGPPLIYAPHLCTIEALWTAPHTRAFLDRLSEHLHLIVYNPRGTGLSDRPRIVTLESRMDDINAVLDATGLDQTSLFGVAESANVCALFASTHPERCRNLVLHWPYTTFDEDEETKDALVREAREHWGERTWMEEFAREISPNYGHDPDLLDWFVWMQRAAVSPSGAAAFTRMQLETDLSDVLPTIRVPTLVAYPADSSEAALAVAERIPGASSVALPSAGVDPYVDGEQLAELIIGAVKEGTVPVVPESVLATLLFTDLTDSTSMAAAIGDRAWKEVLGQHHDDVRRALTRFRGTEVDSAGDGFFCRFDGPARAIECAKAIVAEAADRGLQVRAGLHTGECELLGPKPAGIAVVIGARVMSHAEPGEVLVSRTVTDLVAGSGNTFVPRGEHTLKGVPGTWALFAVER